jgi:hypothetical protein
VNGYEILTDPEQISRAHSLNDPESLTDFVNDLSNTTERYSPSRC